MDIKESKNIEIELQMIENDKQREMFNRIVRTHHSYVPTTSYGGRQINFIIKDVNTHEIYGCIGVGSGILAMKDRDTFIGWNKDMRLKNLGMIANNWRFCMIENPPHNLGTKVLSKFVKESRKEWRKKYNQDLMLIETLVEPPHTGVVYQASSWQMIGWTKGTSFKWINKDEYENYQKDGWGVSRKNMKYGDKIDENKWQIVKEDNTKKKMIYVKTLSPFWKQQLNKIHEVKETA